MLQRKCARIIYLAWILESSVIWEGLCLRWSWYKGEEEVKWDNVFEFVGQKGSECFLGFKQRQQQQQLHQNTTYMCLGMCIMLSMFVMFSNSTGDNVMRIYSFAEQRSARDSDRSIGAHKSRRSLAKELQIRRCLSARHCVNQHKIIN